MTASSPAPPTAFLISERTTRIVVLRDGERRERRPVADLEFLKDMMKMHFDRPVGNIQSTTNFLVR